MERQKPKFYKVHLKGEKSMSRARREKEQEINWKVLIPIICVIVVVIIFFVVRNVQNKERENETQNTLNSENEVQNRGNELTEENFVEENTVEDSNENEESNATENNISEEPEPDVTINESSAPARPGITDQKQKAIELVKKEWGQDDTVNFAFDYVNENGEYVIAVKDNATTAVKNYFRVNLEKGTVELD